MLLLMMMMMVAGDLLQHSRILVADKRPVSSGLRNIFLEQIFMGFMKCELNTHPFLTNRCWALALSQFYGGENIFKHHHRAIDVRKFDRIKYKSIFFPYLDFCLMDFNLKAPTIYTTSGVLHDNGNHCAEIIWAARWKKNSQEYISRAANEHCVCAHCALRHMITDDKQQS